MKPSDSSLRIDRLTLGGEGVGRLDGLAVFVPHTAPGDLVEIELTENLGRFARAKLVRVVEPGPGRVDPPCRYHFRLAEERGERSEKRSACGGCSLQHMNYQTQLTIKRQLVLETLERLGGLKGVSVEPVIGMSDPWRYRNKVQQPVGLEGVWPRSVAGPDLPDGRQTPVRVISGFYVSGSHDILPIDDCLVQTELSVAIIQHVKELLTTFAAIPYDETQHTGWIRHVIVRTAGEGAAQKALLAFVTRTPDFPNEKEIVSALVEKFPALAGIHQNVQSAKSNVILGKVWRKLHGIDHIEEQMGSLRFRLSAASFFQVNTRQAEALYNVVKEMAGKGERLLDLYTGVGTIALWLADRFQQIGGVEENPVAIGDADSNAELNGIENVRFTAQPVEKFLTNLNRQAGGKALTVVMDPPRSGVDPRVLDALGKLLPGKIIYVSCDPATLARDLKLLGKHHYQVEKVQPVDLFPQTPHIETAVLLTHTNRAS